MSHSNWYQGNSFVPYNIRLFGYTFNMANNNKIQGRILQIFNLQ